jgi:ComF family protein
MTKKDFFAYLSDLFFVPKCAGCEERLPPNPSVCLCPACLSIYNLETTKECAKCAKVMSECSCSTENLEKAKILRLAKLTVYLPHSNDYVVNKMIFKLKKKSEYHLVEFLSNQLASTIKSVIKPNESYIVTYAPRSKKAISKYGYDHMEILSRKTAELLGLKWAKLLKRDSNVEQKTLSYNERMKRISISYENKKNVDIKGKSVILLDDIVTSGATLCAGARILRKNGAQTVSCAVVGISRNTYVAYRLKLKKRKY